MGGLATNQQSCSLGSSDDNPLMSCRPELIHESGGVHRRELFAVLGVVVDVGTLAWVAVFVGGSYWALVVGAVVALLVSMVEARDRSAFAAGERMRLVWRSSC